ncbi:hypothetical protein [Croceicoccus sp. BE223]|uniref:hypothetical protein n=1 Tax=Croceicoccus sp. BE223 TaxID=2817716 RepID=UPI00285B5B00|nr:hypothetical protein [Croceicoccus sp. BE223]MDR7101030.1 hypothetical protein [Croceicoccus sp. BE223]
MNPALFALVALVPAMLGSAPRQDSRAELVARLCNGGAVVIPLPGKAPAPPARCAQKGCHAGCNRKRLDPSQ